MTKDEKEKKETPIIDGDARPDMPIHPEKEKSKKPLRKNSKEEAKVTTERVSDINSLEDYKDAK